MYIYQCISINVYLYDYIYIVFYVYVYLYLCLCLCLSMSLIGDRTVDLLLCLPPCFCHGSANCILAIPIVWWL